MISEALAVVAAAVAAGSAIAGGELASTRKPGEKVDVVAYAAPKEYASFPQLIRTDKELVILFQSQSIDKLKRDGMHPHYQRFAVPKWLISKDGALSWTSAAKSPQIGKVVDTSYGSAPLGDGGMVSLSYSDKPPIFSIIEHGTATYRPYQDIHIPGAQVHYIPDNGPFGHQYPFDMLQMSDDSLLATSYCYAKGTRTPEKLVVVFFRSIDDGKTWQYLSMIEDNNVFGLGECAVVEAGKGRIIAILRACLDGLPLDKYPSDAITSEKGYGYFIYQSVSNDYGRTWSRPAKLSLWGHPAQLRKLKSGNILMVYGVRRQPHRVEAVLSRDGGRTWDLSSRKTVHTFSYPNYDVGYPVITQNDDGSIVCAYYGYSTADAGEHAPHGIFVSVFDEQWLQHAQ